MNMQELFSLLKTQNCWLTYDGSVSMHRDKQLPLTLCAGFLDSLLLFSHYSTLELSDVELEYAEVTAQGIKLHLKIEMSTAIKICQNNRWKYQLSFTPIDEDGLAEQALNIEVPTGPIHVTVIEYTHQRKRQSLLLNCGKRLLHLHKLISIVSCSPARAQSNHPARAEFPVCADCTKKFSTFACGKLSTMLPKLWKSGKLLVCVSMQRFFLTFSDYDVENFQHFPQSFQLKFYFTVSFLQEPSKYFSVLNHYSGKTFVKVHKNSRRFRLLSERIRGKLLTVSFQQLKCEKLFACY